MPGWSTGPKGAPGSVGHRMGRDHHGRPGSPLCGCSTDGLWWRGELDWEQVPPAQRCPDSDRPVGSAATGEVSDAVQGPGQELSGEVPEVR